MLDAVSFSDVLLSAKAEESLYENLSKETFRKLKLPPFTYPYPYQGLPRDLSREGLLHRNFNDLDILKKRLLDKAMLWPYHELHMRNDSSVVVLTYVIPGGLGDYFAGLLTMEVLKKLMPNIQLYFMPILSDKAPSLPASTYGETHEIRFPSDQSLSLEIFSEKHRSLLQRASLIVQIPTLCPLWDSLHRTFKKKNILLPSETIGEYGFIHSTQFHPKTSTRCLGLHFLELGLFIPPPRNYRIEDLSKHIKNLQMPYYFAYLYTRAGHQLYLHLLTESLRDQTAPIHLYTPSIGKFLLLIEKIQEDLDLRKIFIQARIQKIELYFMDKKSTIPLQAEGKTLVIYNTGTLTHEEFLTFLHFSQEPVGIRGNLSVSEALSMKKVFFYDPIEHNLTFHQGLVALAEQRLRSFPSVISLIKLSASTENLIEAGEKLAKAITSPKISEGFKKLSRIIEREHRANELLSCIVKRRFFHELYPEFPSMEKTLIKRFCKNESSFEELITKQRSEIDKRLSCPSVTVK